MTAHVPTEEVGQARSPLPGVRVGLVGPVPPELGGLAPGGVATHQAELARGLAEAGVHVVALATNARDGAATARLAEPYGYRLLAARVPRRWTDWLVLPFQRPFGGAAGARYAWRLARWRGTEPLGSRQVALGSMLAYRHFIRATRPTLLHVQHPLERHLYARLVRAFEGWRLPLVVTLHSFFDEHPVELIERLMRPNLRHADALIAVSRSTAEQAEQLGADPSKLHVIRSGVDTVRFAPSDRSAARQALGLPASGGLVLFVGNLEPRKAVPRLVQAFASARAAHPDARLAVVGSGESAGAENQEPHVRELVRTTGLQDAVRLVGRVSDAALPRWYAAADVFALPSTSEAQGLSALEAMASGRPVVASAVGGLLDTIEDGRTGYLVPPGDVEGLASRLSRLLSDPALRDEMGAAAREVALRDFSWQAAVARTIEVYRQVVRG